MFDLFGDLPMAKGAQSSSKAKDTKDDKNEKKREDDSTPKDDEQQQNEIEQGKAKEKKPKSIVATLGNAGTTVSFVPLALKRRKRQNPVGNSSVNVKKRQTSTLTLTTESAVSKNEAKSLVIKDQNINNNPIIPTEVPTIIKESDTTIITHKVKDQKQITHPHDIPNKSKDTGIINNQETDDENEYVESEELQKLHISIHPYDMYDPMEPNDYLAYKQNKKNEDMRKDLERQAKKTLELQLQLREQIEEERKKVLESGDVDKIIESRTDGSGGGIVGRGRGRGRGRGMSNLPAWLIKKQQENQVESSTPRQQKDGQFDDAMIPKKQGYIVVLSNMVGPDEVDDELKEEVKEECELKCGKVIDVRIEVSDEVKVFVTFQNESDAKEAPKIFHGRMFGPRQIKSHLLI